MGCDTYEVEGTTVRFSEMDDEFVGCLCSFPRSDCGRLLSDRILSLALLGAAVVLLNHGEIDGPVILPDDLPSWIVDEIDRIVPE